MSSLTVDLTGRTAIVTGATKGIGREIALRLADAGCDLGITGRDTGELESLRQRITDKGRRCWLRAADLASVTETLGMAEYLCERIERVDILVNNAGTSFPEPLVDLDPEHWDTTLNVNLRAPALISKVVASRMIAAGGGAIVNVSSQSGELALTEHAAYCASKFGLNGLTKVMALELGPHGIRVNAVAPTITLTPMGEKVWGDPEKSRPMLERVPLGKFAYPPDVADAVLFLVSDAAAMIHGEVLMIDGGYSVQ